MDVLLILIAVKAPARAYFAALLGVIGSAAGNVILFEMARLGVSRLVRIAERPGRFRLWFHRYGLVTVFIPAATPAAHPRKPSIASPVSTSTTRPPGYPRRINGRDH